MTDDDRIAAGQLPRITWPERGLMGFAPTVTKDNAGAMLALARRIPDAVVEWPAASLAEVRTRLNQIGAMWAGLTDKATGYHVGGVVPLSPQLLFGEQGPEGPDGPGLHGNVVEYADGCMTIECIPAQRVDTNYWAGVMISGETISKGELIAPTVYIGTEQRPSAEDAKQYAFRITAPNGQVAHTTRWLTPEQADGLMPAPQPAATAKPALAGLTTCNDRTDSAGRSPYLGVVG